MPERDHRPALNCLRGLAALAVLLYHFKFYADFPIIERFPWLVFGQLGVDFFFILSGLIISHVYFAACANGTTTIREFLFLRLSRLFPVHALIMVMLLAAALIAGRELTRTEVADWLSLTFLVRQWLLPEGYAWNSPAWSISAELFAYAVVFPAVVLGTRRLDARAAALALAGLGWLLLQLLALRFGTLTEDGGAAPLVRVTAGFLLGAGMYRFLADRAPTRGADWLVLAGLATVVAAAALGLQLLVVIGLVLTISGAYLSRGPLGRAMAHRVPFYLGEISFSLYLVHIPLFRLGGAAAGAAGIERGYAFCAVMAVSALIAAALLYETFEVPARRALRSWWTRRQATSSPLAAG